MVVVSKIKLDIQLDYAKGLEIVDWKCSLFQPCVTEDNHQAQQKYCWNVKKENVFSCQDDETVKIDHQHANDNIQKSAAQTCACKSYLFYLNPNFNGSFLAIESNFTNARYYLWLDFFQLSYKNQACPWN